MSEARRGTPRRHVSWWLVAGWLAVACGLPAEADAQAPSDFIAYPRTLTDMDQLRNPKNPRQLPFNRMPGLSPDYEIGAGDELEVTVVGVNNDPWSAKVSGRGEIAVPLVGPVQVQGLTAEQVENAIAEAYKSRQLINDPQVLVFIASYEAKTIYALGEIDRPGEYGVSFRTTLMDLIFMAGGIDFTAARYGFLHRRAAGAQAWRPTFVNAHAEDLATAPERPRDGGEVVKVDLQPLKEGGVLNPDIVLRNGDVFYVPRRPVDLVYVIGDVMRAGAIELPPEKRLTASQAISWAGGPSRTAKASRSLLVRYEPGGVRREFHLDFGDLLAGRQTDIEVLPNDVIYVPGSNAKATGYGILNIVPTILVGTVAF